MDSKTLNLLVHDREAACYDERFAIDYSRIARAVRLDMESLLGSSPAVARRALDFCCGTGYAAIGLAAAGYATEVHACDLSSAMLERTQKNAADAGVAVPVAQCDGEMLPYADSSFDLVVARGALHHLPSPLDGLREVRRVLQPGGTAVVLAEPTEAGEKQVAAVVGTLARGVDALRRRRGRDKDPEHHQWELASMAANLHTFSRRDIASLAREAGFADVRVETAWWSWILALGLNYYLSGESRFVESNPAARSIRYALVDGAQMLDRFAGTLVPARWRHTVQAVLR
ncbi:MAG TPA: methyltransferase domain-containing protein [Actinomycetota bacterium]